MAGGERFFYLRGDRKGNGGKGAEGWCGWSKLTRGLPCSQRVLGASVCRKGSGGRGGSWSSLFLEGLEGEYPA